MVMIPPVQGGDPGSIPGLRTLFFFFVEGKGGYEVNNKWIEFDENVFCWKKQIKLFYVGIRFHVDKKSQEKCCFLLYTKVVVELSGFLVVNLVFIRSHLYNENEVKWDGKHCDLTIIVVVVLWNASFFIVLMFANNTHNMLFCCKKLVFNNNFARILDVKNSFHPKCCYSFFFDLYIVVNTQHNISTIYFQVVGEFHFSYNKLKFLLRTSNVVCFFLESLWLLSFFSISW